MVLHEIFVAALQQQAQATVIETRRSASQPTLGILRWRWQLFNAAGKEVLDLEATSLLELAV